MLIAALQEHPQRHVEIFSPDCVQLRFPMRVHLCRSLHAYLIQHAKATEPLLEAFFTWEVDL